MMRFRSFMARLKRLKIIPLPIIIGLIISANAFYLRSSILGATALIAYMALTSFLLAKVFLQNEEEGVVRFMLGFFITFSFFVVVSAPLLIFFKLDLIGLTIILFAPLIPLALLMLIKKSRHKTKSEETEERKNAPLFSLTYAIYLTLIGYSLYLLIQARSGWIYGTIWSVVSPYFFTTYFLAGFILVGIILYSSTRATSKLALIIPYALIAAMVPAIVLYPGNSGDPLDHMGFARLVVDYGSFRLYSWARYLNPWSLYWLVKEKALPLSTAIFAKILSIDVYWTHTFITPLLWGTFIPLATYKMSKLLDIGERVSLIASFFAAVYMNFLGWGSRSTGNSFGFIPFLVSVCFSISYLKQHKNRMALFLALLTAITSFISHPLTGIMALILVFLAVTLKMYEVIKLKSKFQARFLLGVSLLICIFAIPAFFGLNSLVYAIFAPQYASEATTRFSLQKLLQTDIWALIFGEYATYEFKDLILSATIPFIGIAGLAYALRNETRTQSKKVSILFSGLALMTLIIVYRILNYAMIDVLFGPKRLWTFQDMLFIPFVALAIDKIITYFEGIKTSSPTKLLKIEKWKIKIAWRHVLAAILMGLALTAFGLFSVHESYGRYGGMQLTELEVQAVKYIDEHAEGRYVVTTVPATTQVGWGFVGMWNPAKYYVYSKDLGQHPTVGGLFEHMSIYQAGVGYYIASSFRTPNFEEAVEEASQIFGLLEILSNEKGSIYIFDYKLAPIPPTTDADVTAFYWDTPAGYYIQNGLLRVIFNPATKSLNVVDFWGDLYEGLNLNTTTVDGEDLGNFVSIERYNTQNETWVKWNPTDQIPSSPQFKFRINFENEALIGFVETATPSVQVWWDNTETTTISLQTGDFARIYVPGLVEGRNSYNVTSRNYGMFYTLNRTPNVVLRPKYNYDMATNALTYNEIVNYCNLSITDSYLSYEFYIQNNATIGQWASIEMWLPDILYKGIFPPIRYSLDGETWSGSVAYSNLLKGEPIKTLNGDEVNWAFSQILKATEEPDIWRGFTKATGDTPTLPETFTPAGGGENRFLFGLYLPPEDTALLKIGFATYYSRPLKITYVFKDSDDIDYGLRNMNQASIKYYQFSSSAYVGGFSATTMPTSLQITQDENNKIHTIALTFQGDSTISLLAARNVNTLIDINGDGIPDNI